MNADAQSLLLPADPALEGDNLESNRLFEGGDLRLHRQGGLKRHYSPVITVQLLRN